MTWIASSVGEGRNSLRRARWSSAHRSIGIGIKRHGMVMRTKDRKAVSRLADTLEAHPAILDFRIAPTGD